MEPNKFAQFNRMIRKNRISIVNQMLDYYILAETTGMPKQSLKEISANTGVSLWKIKALLAAKRLMYVVSL